MTELIMLLGDFVFSKWSNGCSTRISLFACLMANVAFGWHEQVVHCRITKEAVESSSNFAPTMTRLHFGEADTQLPYAIVYATAAAQACPAVGLLPRTPSGLVQAGSVLEDGIGLGFDFCQIFPLLCGTQKIPDLGEFKFIRPINHFQDPSGHTLLGATPAQSWAWDCSDNSYTWLNAIDYCERAIGEYLPSDRQYYEEKFLVALGANLHLLQDQTSPAHTRLDPHIGKSVPGGEFVTGGSLLEENGPLYVNMQRNEFGSGGPKVGGTHRGFFTSAIVQTNTQFFSEDTILRRYAIPGKTDVALSDNNVCQAYFDVLRDEYVVATSDFYGDRNRLAMQVVTPHVGFPYLSIDMVMFGSHCDIHGINSVIYDNLSFLVPRAIGYSRGLIDHFFRGGLEMMQIPDGSLRLRNESRGPDPDNDFAWRPIAGKPSPSLLFYAEDIEGRRSLFYSMNLPGGFLDLHQEFDLADFASRIPAESVDQYGRSRIYVIIRDVAVGKEIGVVAGCLDWCSALCFPGGAPHPIVSLGDVDGNGGDDIAVGVPNASLTSGAIQAYEGGECGMLWEQKSEVMPTFGYFLLAVGRVDDDAYADLISYDGIRAYVISGRTGEILYEYATELRADDALGDVDGDGRGDLVVKRDSEAWVIAAATGEVERIIAVPGTVRNTTPDWDNDGGRDLLVCGSDTQIVSSGSSAVLYSSADLEQHDLERYLPSLVVEVPSLGPGPLFVGMTVDPGELALVDGSTGLAVWSHRWDSLGLNGLNSIQGRLDFDGDGSEDVLIFGLSWNEALYSHLIALDGRTGAILADQDHKVVGYDEPPSVLGDVNGDGKEDVGMFVSEQGYRRCMRLMLGR